MTNVLEIKVSKTKVFDKELLLPCAIYKGEEYGFLKITGCANENHSAFVRT